MCNQIAKTLKSTKNHDILKKVYINMFILTQKISFRIHILCNIFLIFIVSS